VEHKGSWVNLDLGCGLAALSPLLPHQEVTALLRPHTHTHTHPHTHTHKKKSPKRALALAKGHLGKKTGPAAAGVLRYDPFRQAEMVDAGGIAPPLAVRFRLAETAQTKGRRRVPGACTCTHQPARTATGHARGRCKSGSIQHCTCRPCPLAPGGSPLSPPSAPRTRELE
jgi:hypothetical protein